MTILLYSDYLKLIEKSGVGRAIKHQIKALELNNISYTLNSNDNYDILHINTVFLRSYFMAKRAKRNGKKVVYHAHSTEEDFRNSFIFSNFLSPLFKWWIKKCYSTADLIITPTEYSKKLLQSYNLNKNIVSISNGIELDFYSRNLAENDYFQKNFNFSKDDKVIISVGLYIERKGILDFVELAKKLPEYKFVWFGYTNLYTVPKKIRNAVNTKLDNLFFPGYVSKEELKKAYCSCNLFFFPTYEETEGIVLLEALALKVPILIRDIPIYKNWFNENKDLYKGKNIRDFENKIKGIVENNLESLTENGYQKVCSLDIKNIGKLLKNNYYKLCN